MIFERRQKYYGVKGNLSMTVEQVFFPLVIPVPQVYFLCHLLSMTVEQVYFLGHLLSMTVEQVYFLGHFLSMTVEGVYFLRSSLKYDC